MANKKNETAQNGGAPPLDFFDLSYVTPVLTAHALSERPHVPFHIGSLLKAGGALAQRGGNAARRIVFEKFFKTFATPLDRVKENRGAIVANWFVSQYEPRMYPYIVLGPPLGSMAYLSGVLDAPFLPLNYRMFIAHDHRIHPDKIGDHAARGKELADAILPRDEDVELVSEYDPVHARFRVSGGTMMRFKFLRLPRSYAQFIRTCLAPGGSIIVVEARTGWTQYFIQDRLNLQVGLTGGISDDEFLRGSKRIGEFRGKHAGEEKAVYRLNRRSEVVPESQFGVSPVLRASILQEAERLQRPLCHLFTGDIYQVNDLVSHLYLRCARREGKRPSRFFIHSGLFVSPHDCMNALLLPLWVPDASLVSLNFAKRFLASYPFDSELVALALEPCVSGPPDAASYDDWKKAASARGAVRAIANTPKIFPHDFTAYFSFWKSMRGFANRLRDPLDIRVTLDMVLEESERCRIYFNMHQR